MPPKKSLDDQLTFPLKGTEKAQLEALANQFRITKSALMRRILTDYLNSEDPAKIMISEPKNSVAALEQPVSLEG